MNSPKLVPYSKANYFFKSIKKKNLSISQCHGTFDLLHPGHVLHLEEAKKLCDLLVVTITSEEFVNKGPGRPYFNNDLRVKSLCALDDVFHDIDPSDTLTFLRVAQSESLKPFWKTYCNNELLKKLPKRKLRTIDVRVALIMSNCLASSTELVCGRHRPTRGCNSGQRRG